MLLGDRPLGEVREVFSGPANDVLEVAPAPVADDPGATAPPVLIPFTADAVVDLDVPGRRIVIRPDLLGAE